MRRRAQSADTAGHGMAFKTPTPKTSGWPDLAMTAPAAETSE